MMFSGFKFYSLRVTGLDLMITRTVILKKIESNGNIVKLNTLSFMN